jgi:hypothetical protein
MYTSESLIPCGLGYLVVCIKLLGIFRPYFLTRNAQKKWGKKAPKTKIKVNGSPRINVGNRSLCSPSTYRDRDLLANFVNEWRGIIHSEGIELN